MTNGERQVAEINIRETTLRLKQMVDGYVSAGVVTGPECAVMIMQVLGVAQPPPFLAQAAARHIGVGK